jgi:small subunit ribosomal protein S11
MNKALAEAKSVAEAGMSNRPSTTDAFGELHHLHVFATKHNTHVTLTRPNREPMLSLSAGNINFKKAHRGTFDAAYQLVTYSIAQMIEKGFLQRIEKIEVIMRGFGPGREAFQKALLGTEGRAIQPKIYRVTDSTRLKFGGTRSPSVRRL